MPLTGCTGMGLRDDLRRLCPYRAWVLRLYMLAAYKVLEKGSLTRMASYARTKPATEMCTYESLAIPYTVLHYRRSNTHITLHDSIRQALGLLRVSGNYLPDCASGRLRDT